MFPDNLIAVVSPKGPHGYVLINRSDFDPAVHRVFDPNAPEPEPVPLTPENPVTPGPASGPMAPAEDVVDPPAPRSHKAAPKKK